MPRGRCSQSPSAVVSNTGIGLGDRFDWTGLLPRTLFGNHALALFVGDRGGEADEHLTEIPAEDDHGQG
jgi:hypothetical protein